MDLKTFKNDEEIVQYLKSQLENIGILNECRFFKEEQLQLSEEIILFRNCIEWVLRSNQVIMNINYALRKCLEFAEKMLWPLEETENKRLYAYYLEDAVYRNLVLWDMFRQLLNEFYRCGYSESDNVSIFKFLKEKKTEIGDVKVNRILNYLNSSNHKLVRETLRNSFTHSVETTSSYVFHRKVNGKIKPQMNYFLPKHPFENLNIVIMDVFQLIKFMREVVMEMYEHRKNNLILLEVVTIMPCGKVIDDSEPWNLCRLQEKYERILVPCDTPCDKSHLYNDIHVCKPVKVNYQRIHSKQDETSGVLCPTMAYVEMEKAFGISD